MLTHSLRQRDASCDQAASVSIVNCSTDEIGPGRKRGLLDLLPTRCPDFQKRLTHRWMYFRTRLLRQAVVLFGKAVLRSNRHSSFVRVNYRNARPNCIIAQSCAIVEMFNRHSLTRSCL
jgi:hypothetical protein